MKHTKTALLLAMPLAISIALAQTPATPPPCVKAENRQFDFWIGDWDVSTPDGKYVGSNLIKPVYGACALSESWTTPNLKGQSFNAYDDDRGVWHQTWIDSTGGLLVMDGGMKNGAMVMSDAYLHGKKEAKEINEVTWTPAADGSVRQLWRVSKDSGKTWATSFDGKYVRANRPQPSAPAPVVKASK